MRNIDLTGLIKIKARGTKEEEEMKFQAVMRRTKRGILESIVRPELLKEWDRKNEN